MMPAPPIRNRSDTTIRAESRPASPPLASARQIGSHRQRHSGRQTPVRSFSPATTPTPRAEAIGSTASRHPF